MEEDKIRNEFDKAYKGKSIDGTYLKLTDLAYFKDGIKVGSKQAINEIVEMLKADIAYYEKLEKDYKGSDYSDRISQCQNVIQEIEAKHNNTPNKPE